MPRQRLSTEQELAQKFGVGRSSIREAIIDAGGNQLFIAIYHALHAFMHAEIEDHNSRRDHGQLQESSA